jgi:hypothetical protein
MNNEQEMILKIILNKVESIENSFDTFRDRADITHLDFEKRITSAEEKAKNFGVVFGIIGSIFMGLIINIGEHLWKK